MDFYYTKIIGGNKQAIIILEPDTSVLYLPRILGSFASISTDNY